MESIRYKKIYKSINGLAKDKIFEEELELIYVSQDLEVVHTPDNKQVERLSIATALMKAFNGKFYKIILQENNSSLNEYKNVESFKVLETITVDVQEIGGWKQNVGNGFTKMIMTDYYLPKGKGKHLIKVTSLDSHTIQLGKYCTLEAFRTDNNTDARLGGDYFENMTDKHNGKTISHHYLEGLADELGLEKAYNFNR